MLEMAMKIAWTVVLLLPSPILAGVTVSWWLEGARGPATLMLFNTIFATACGLTVAFWILR
jgi:hypothetical protein